MTAIEIPTPDPRALDDASRPFAEAIAQHYAVKRELGRGGMGVVFLARDRRLDRLVAIKTLPPQLAKDAIVRERFIREIRTAGGLAHPNIVPIHGADEIDGHVFFVMAFVDGESLASHIRAQERLSPRDVVNHLRDVASALTHAHGRDIIHRDIKAENVLVDRSSGRAMVTDFGIARIAEATPLTVTGQLLGTVYYVSPEQVSGGKVDGRSDIYSLGVVGFLALTGRFPFEDEIASAVLVAHVTKAAPPVASVNRDIPASVATIIDRCLMKDPTHRYANASDLVAALDGAIGDLAHPAAPRRAPEPRVSDTEAHAVWKRAAELQAMTGIQPRPEAVARERDPRKNKKDGLEVSELRAAALEAGIDEPYVEHALVEHGLKNGGRVDPQVEGDRGSVKKQDRSRSLSSVLINELDVPGELPTRDFERVLNLLRDETGVLGHTQARTRELSWWTGRFGIRLDVAVVPRAGRTAIRITKSLRRSMVVTTIASFMFVGSITGAMVGAGLLEAFGADAEGVAVLTALAAAASSSVWVARRVIRRLRDRAERRVQKLGALLADKVRESIGPRSLS